MLKRSFDNLNDPFKKVIRMMVLDKKNPYGKCCKLLLDVIHIGLQIEFNKPSFLTQFLKITGCNIYKIMIKICI